MPSLERGDVRRGRFKPPRTNGMLEEPRPKGRTKRPSQLGAWAKVGYSNHLEGSTWQAARTEGRCGRWTRTPRVGRVGAEVGGQQHNLETLAWPVSEGLLYRFEVDGQRARRYRCLEAGKLSGSQHRPERLLKKKETGKRHGRCQDTTDFCLSAGNGTQTPCRWSRSL